MWARKWFGNTLTRSTTRLDPVGGPESLAGCGGNDRCCLGEKASDLAERGIDIKLYAAIECIFVRSQIGPQPGSLARSRPQVPNRKYGGSDAVKG